MSTLFIGYTRFSVHQYESGSFKATSAAGGFSEAEYTDWLYAPDRLDTRTAIFIEESLPQLEQASQKFDLVHIVAISPSLPEKYKTALQQARTRYPFLRIHETKQRAAPSHPNLQLVKTMLTKRGLAGQVFGMYRLDDDDLLPIDYFDRMTQYVTDEHVGYRVSLPRASGPYVRRTGTCSPGRSMRLSLPPGSSPSTDSPQTARRSTVWKPDTTSKATTKRTATSLSSWMAASPDSSGPAIKPRTAP